MSFSCGSCQLRFLFADAILGDNVMMMKFFLSILGFNVTIVNFKKDRDVKFYEEGEQ